ncbi:enoyl-CoA hydratase/isomerase family protein [Streptomyces sp. NPDC058001]|uniref:enoyl-CoA hydratase/isomerase family protein n=1 Tax=Streptomyces sp. NPDC058001 TaxID=3346300 RepID=UPI0036E17259
MPEENLHLSEAGQVALIALNRPDRLNALSHSLLVDLRRALRDADRDSGIRAIVLTGEGRAFSSGADLRGEPRDAEEVVRTLYNPLTTELLSLGTPVVAAVNGVAAGAAVSLALACDLRIASESASFQLSFVKVGLVPDAGATWLLPRAVGAGRAAEMALLGRSVPADEALAWGLVNEVTPADTVRERALAVAADLAALSRSVGTTRQLLNRSFDIGLGDQLDREASAQGRAQHGADYLEARRAFAEKRAPRFA